VPGGYYVVVSGTAGSGKTTLAVPLAAELQLPLICKDSIKEAMADVLRLGDDAWSQDPAPRGVAKLAISQ